MRTVLIISYFFPPCNLTAGQRPHSWYRHLHAFGYYPVVVTRKWEKEIGTFADANQLSSPGIQIEKNDWGEIHYLPYTGNLRDRLMARYGTARFSTLRRLLSLYELIFGNFFLSAIPYRNFYRHAAALCSERKPVGAVISGGPFQQFFFGYLLSKKQRLPWIADYRDDWSTDDVNRGGGFMFRLLKKLNRRAEVKWLGTAAAFTTISTHYRNKIERIVSAQGHVVQNGFSETHFSQGQTDPHIRLLYNGTLYPSQPVEDLLNDVAAHNASATQKISLDFPGLGIDASQKNRVESLAQNLGLLPVIHITARVPKAEVVEKQKRATALVMFGHRGLKGIPSSKVYEYLGMGKPIILFEPDGDVLEEIVGGYNLGFIVGKHGSFEEIMREIGRLTRENTLQPDISYIQNFSRESQVGLLADFMDRYFG